MLDGPLTEPGGAHTTSTTYAYLNVALLAVAAYNTLELLIWIFHFFKRRCGLYFWSILVCTVSIGVFDLFAFLAYFRLAPFRITGPGMAITLPSLLCAQSLVLYSRLHLITPKGPLLRFVFWVIIVTSIILLLPFTIILIGLSTGNVHLAGPQYYAEQHMITGTVIREILICALYIHQSARQLAPIITIKEAAGRRVLLHIMLVNIAVIILDILTLLLLYHSRSGMGSAYTCMSHSVKLRMEFVVLNNLLELLGAPMRFRGPRWDTETGTGTNSEAGAGWNSNHASQIEMVHAHTYSPPLHPCNWVAAPRRVWGVQAPRGSI